MAHLKSEFTERWLRVWYASEPDEFSAFSTLHEGTLQSAILNVDRRRCCGGDETVAAQPADRSQYGQADRDASLTDHRSSIRRTQ